MTDGADCRLHLLFTYMVNADSEATFNENVHLMNSHISSKKFDLVKYVDHRARERLSYAKYCIRDIAGSRFQTSSNCCEQNHSSLLQLLGVTDGMKAKLSLLANAKQLIRRSNDLVAKLNQVLSVASLQKKAIQKNLTDNVEKINDNYLSILKDSAKHLYIMKGLFDYHRILSHQHYLQYT